MFERNRIDNATIGSQAGLPVEITLEGGDVLVGKLAILVGRGLADLLNGANMFLEFEPYEGERMMIAKAAIRTIKTVSVPGAGHLKAYLRQIEGFEPGQVLGVAPGAPMDEIRQAYHRLAKAYHPDRFASAGLPPEIDEYLSAVVRRINMAYDSLETAEAARQRTAARRSQASRVTA